MHADQTTSGTREGTATTAATAENGHSCVLLRAGERFDSQQGHTAFHGITRERAGARALGMHRVEIPPGGRAHAHLHPEHESAICLIQGEADVWHGEGLREFFVMRPGDLVYIPPGVPHLPINRSTTETVIAVVARTDANEDEAVELVPVPDHVDAPHHDLARSAAGAREPA